MALPKLPNPPNPGKDKETVSETPASAPRVKRRSSPKLPSLDDAPSRLPQPSTEPEENATEDFEEFLTEDSDNTENSPETAEDDMDLSDLENFLNQPDDETPDDSDTADNETELDLDDLEAFLEDDSSDGSTEDDEWEIEDIDDNDSEDDGFTTIENREDNVTDSNSEEDEIDLEDLEDFLSENENLIEEPPVAEEDAEEPTSEQKAGEEKDKPKGGFFSQMKNKWNGFVEKAKEDKASDESKPEEDVPTADEDTDPGIDDEDKNKDDSDNEKEKVGLFKKIGKGYSTIHEAVFKILLKILNFLAKIPFIGKFFRKPLQATRLLKKISHFLPIIVVILIWLLINIFYVSSSYTLELPDEGEVEVSNATYDRSTNTLTAEVENTGDVIADVQTEYIVYSTQIGFNPATWFLPQEVTRCSADWVLVDQGDIETVEAECEDVDPSGFWFRVAPQRVLGTG